jgi:citrate synthase
MLDQIEEDRLIRPSVEYTGEQGREGSAVDERIAL